MVPTLGSLLDRLQGFFSKAFFLAGFLPVAGFIALNAWLATLVFPAYSRRLATIFDLGVSTNIAVWVSLLLFIFVLGQVLFSINPWLRRLLEGRNLPLFLRHWLEQGQYRQLSELIERRSSIAHERFFYRKATLRQPTWSEQLREARIQGDQSRAQGEISEDLKAQYNKMRDYQQLWKTIPFADLEMLFKTLIEELRTKSANALDELDRIQSDFNEILDYAAGKVERITSDLDTETQLRFPRSLVELGPTQLANMAGVHREYGLERYGLDVELLWLRLLKIIRADEEFFPILEDAKIQLDFSVTSTFLVGILTLIWLPLSLWAPSPIPFVLIAMAGPLLVTIFYGIVLQNYRTFTEAVRSSIDLHRFDLLEALHIALPEDAYKEKKLWHDLASWSMGMPGNNIPYQHPSGTDKQTGDQDPTQGEDNI